MEYTTNNCYTYLHIWQDDVLKIKYISAIIGTEWSIYDIIVKAYVGFVQGIIQVISSIIAIIRYKKRSVKKWKNYLIYY